MRYQRNNLVFIQNAKSFFVKSNPLHKQAIVGSIFPRKIEISNNEYRTDNINSLVSALLSIDEGFIGKKMRQSRKIASQPIMAPLSYLLSNQFQEDSRKLYDLTVLLGIGKAVIQPRA